MPRVPLVDVVRNVDAVDDHAIDQRVDIHVDDPRVADTRAREVDVAEPRPAEIRTPEHRPGQVALELLRHRGDASDRTDNGYDSQATERTDLRRLYVLGMSEVADTYDRISAGFDARVQGVADDAWESPAPCEGWTAKDIVGHVAGNAAYAAAGTGFTPTPDSGPREAWQEVNAALAAALRDPEKASVAVSSPFGETTVEGFVQQLLINDTLIHTWDLARATGQDETLDADGVDACAMRWRPSTR